MASRGSPILYFAYGSNMDEEDLEKWCREHGYHPVKPLSKEVAKLKGWRLVFNHYSSGRKGGVANIERCEGEEVWGLLMELSEGDFETLRKKEGAPSVYCEREVEVETREGRVKKAKTFVVENPRGGHVPPTKEYLGLLVRSAKKYGFPPEYIRKLESVETK